MPILLDDQLRQAIRERSKTYDEIAQQTGLSKSWIEKFAHGKIKNPGYRTLLKISEVVMRGTI